MSKGQKQEGEDGTLRDYVYRALTNKAKGVDTTSFANLAKELATLRRKSERDRGELTTVHLLSNMIHALKDCVSALRERKHDALLNEILIIKLWACHPTVRDAVLDFMANLVVANAAFTHTCLQLLVYSFLPPPAPPSQEVERGPWHISEENAMVQQAVMTTLVKVLQMVPTAPSKLLQLITQHMPHKLRDRNTQCLYLSAMLSLAEVRAGAPIRDGLLATAVEHLLSIDVEIRWEDIVDAHTGQEAEEGASENEDELEDIFEIEGMSELDINATPEELERRRKQQQDRGGWEGTRVNAAASTSGRPAVDETADKLDSLMELMFAHLGRRHESGNITELWPTLLSIFERAILNTHRSKFTQYLVFFVCSKQPQPCAAAFVDLLLSRLQDARQPAITRSACAAYVASFLARAAFATPSLVLASLQRLVAVCQEYASSTSSGGAASSTVAGAMGMQRSLSNPTLSAADDMSQHQVFYASIQSVLYILCYQLRMLTSMATSEAQQCAAATQQLVRTQLVPLLNHRLAPLRVCLPSVVAEFKHQAIALGLMDAAALTSSSEDINSRPQRPLEMFFPFDPYLLRRSSKHLRLKETYVRWHHGQPSAHQVPAGTLTAAVVGDSDVSDDEHSDVDDDEQEGMDAGSGDEDSSSEDELEGMSVPSDSILARPGLPPARGVPASKGMAHMPPPSTMLGLHGGLRGKRPLMEDMAMSYSPGHFGSTDDMTPAGTSPVLVNYISPAGASPMQMTPVMHSGMAQAGLRLGRR